MSSNAILTQTLLTIAAESGGKFDRSFDLVDQLLTDFGEEDLANRLYAAISIHCPWEPITDLFDVLVWSTKDNGAAICRTVENWLRAGDDLRRIRIALYMDSYPFLDYSEMVQVMRSVSVRYPEVAARCDELIESRRRLPE